MKKKSVSWAVSLCLCVGLIMPTVSLNAMDMVDSDFSDDIIEYYDETSTSYEEDYMIDSFDEGVGTDGIDMFDSGGSDLITEDYEETEVAGENIDPVNEEAENTGDSFDEGMSTDGFVDSTISSEPELIENESQGLSEIDFWDESPDAVTEISWAAENSEPEITDYSYGLLTEEQIKGLRWFWSKNENLTHQETDETETVTEDISYSDETLTEDIGYLFEAETASEDISYVFDAESATEDDGYSSDVATATEDIGYFGEEETVFEDFSYSGDVETATEEISYSSEEADDASESYDGVIEEIMQTEYDVASEDAAEVEYFEEPMTVESVQEVGTMATDTTAETYQSEEATVDNIEINSAVISGMKLEAFYDYEQKIWCLPIPGRENGMSHDELILMLPDGVYMKDRANA